LEFVHRRIVARAVLYSEDPESWKASYGSEVMGQDFGGSVKVELSELT
jgi:hypothetical protein